MQLDTGKADPGACQRAAETDRFLRLVETVMRSFVFALSAMASLPAVAAPPPPPPEYIWRAAKILTAGKLPDAAAYAPLFADDVVAFENGKTIAKGKVAWLATWSKEVSHYNGHIIGYSETSAGYSDAYGEVLVVDTFDTVDRTDDPSTFLADPRMATRSTLYQFGPDHLVHYLRISKTGGVWMTPRF